MLHIYVISLVLGTSCAIVAPPYPSNISVPATNNPASGSNNPSIRPINPTIRPINPSILPNNPSTRPINPAIRPNNPVIRPNKPAIRPNNPVTGPSNTVPVPINPVASQANPVTGHSNPMAGHASPSTGQTNPVASQASDASGQVNNPIDQVILKAKQTLGHLITEFGLEMSETIHENGEQDTVVFSPLSIATLMTLLMAGMGKQSQTYFETADVLNYNSNGVDEEFIHQLYKYLLNDLSTQNNKISFVMGNQLFLQGDDNNRANILGSFTKTCKDNYNAGIETLNFFSDPFGAANRINEWVNTTTKGKIPQLLTDPLSPQTKFMAVNAVYFKAPWLTPFTAESTFVNSFDTGRQKIDMTYMAEIMNVKRHEQISQIYNATIIELPYKDERYSMFIIKPKGPASLNSVLQLEYALTSENLNSLIETTISKPKITMSVQIPRMRLRYRTYLKDILEKMGATSMFSVKKADFSRISSSNLPILDNMIHEAVMDITEAGTEAAAATSTTSNRYGTSLSFVLNQPSLLFIYDSKNKVPIFWARLVTPESI